MRILFVTWDGPQVNYLESLFLPIFEGMKAHGVHFDVVQFRWGEPALKERLRQQCARAGIGYRAVEIWRAGGGAGPFASAIAGGRHVRRAVRDFGSDIVMPRSLLAGIPVLRAGGAKLKPILFDADGLAADERVEFAGLSPQSLEYRILRHVEARSIREARSVIVRSEKAKDILYDRVGPPVARERFFVVTNGRDERLFTPADAVSRHAVRAELGIDEAAPLIVYAGSAGKQYRFDRIGAFASEMRRRRPDTRLLILSGTPDVAAAEIAAFNPEVLGFSTLMRVDPEAVPRYLAAADVGVAFRSVSFSMQAVAPVKLSEYLLCGVPVVGTAEIGDTQAALDAGVFVDEGLGPELAAEWMEAKVLPNRERMRAISREVGVARFSLERSVQDYMAALEPFKRPPHIQGATQKTLKT